MLGGSRRLRIAERDANMVLVRVNANAHAADRQDHLLISVRIVEAERQRVQGSPPPTPEADR